MAEEAWRPIETAPNAVKTHCSHGHALSGRNLRIDRRGWRQCRACQVRHTANNKRRKKAPLTKAPTTRKASVKAIPFLTPEDIREFEKRVGAPTPLGCHEWQGDRSSKNYGRFVVSGARVMTHRISWQQHNKATIPPGMNVCHTCDNPPCVNPAHLWIGTTKDNSKDMSAKGRGRVPRKGERLGSTNPNSKINEELVRVIRADNRSQHTIAEEHGISQSCVRHVKRHLTWNHVL